jgi:hypothetical protein
MLITNWLLLYLVLCLAFYWFIFSTAQEGE